MKKFYKVLIRRCDCEGKDTWYDEEFVHTADISDYLEKKQEQIEKMPDWRMSHTSDDNWRPEIRAIEISFIEM